MDSVVLILVQVEVGAAILGVEVFVLFSSLAIRILIFLLFQNVVAFDAGVVLLTLVAE